MKQEYLDNIRQVLSSIDSHEKFSSASEVFTSSPWMDSDLRRCYYDEKFVEGKVLGGSGTMQIENPRLTGRGAAWLANLR